MHFNVLNLETRLKKLESLRDSTENINRKIELSRDIQSLKTMINYVSGFKYKILEGEKTFDDSLVYKTDELASFLSTARRVQILQLLHLMQLNMQKLKVKSWF